MDAVNGHHILSYPRQALWHVWKEIRSFENMDRDASEHNNLFCHFLFVSQISGSLGMRVLALQKQVGIGSMTESEKKGRSVHLR